MKPALRAHVSSGDWAGLLDVLMHDEALLGQPEELSELLHALAALPGSAPVLEYLPRNGAGINHVAAGGANALGMCMMGGSRFGATTLRELRVLLRGGADLAQPAESGYPPLHWAIVRNRLEHARLLLAFGADPRQRTGDDESALDVARRCRNEHAIEMLEAFEQLQE